MFPSGRLAEGGVEGAISSLHGLVPRHLAIGPAATLQQEGPQQAWPVWTQHSHVDGAASHMMGTRRYSEDTKIRSANSVAL